MKFSFDTAQQLGHSLSRALVDMTMATPLASLLTRAASPTEIEHLLKDAQAHHVNGNEPVDLAKLLSKAGYTNVISNLSLRAGHFFSFSKLNLEGLHFANCTFDGSHLDEAKIKNCTWEKCSFIETAFTHSQLAETRFTDCHFQQPTFLATSLHKVGFENCAQINEASFEDSKLQECHFDHSNLSACHFLNAQVSDSKISHSRLDDVHFFNQRAGFQVDATSTQLERQTRPAAATLFNPHARGVSIPRVGKKISELANATPIRVAMQSSQSTQEQMNAEVERFLQLVQADPQHPGHEASHLAEQLIVAAKAQPADFPCMNEVIDKARNIARHVNAVVLPGGEDIPPALYGGAPAKDTNWGGDYRRSVLELALIHECLNGGLPLLAICRGFQMASIYHGSALLQDIGDSERGVRQLPRQGGHGSGIFANTLSGLRTAVYHHQAVPAESPAMRYLEPSSVRNGWVMAAESMYHGSPPTFGVQFHPEFFNSDDSVRGRVSLTELETLTGANERAEDAGLQDPAELVSSGIVNYMSANNDQIIGILDQVANTHWSKSQVVEPQALLEQKARLRSNDFAQRFS